MPDDDFRPDEIPAWAIRKPGESPWDRWETKARRAGLHEHIVQLGRSLTRKAYQHNWPEKLQHECGCHDEGEAMLQLALERPQEACQRWLHLLETDGGQTFWDEYSGGFRPPSDFN